MIFIMNPEKKNPAHQTFIIVHRFLCGEGIFVSRVRLQCVSVDKNLTNIQHFTFFLLSSIFVFF